MFEFLLEKDWHYRDSGTLDVTHLRFFTEKSLRFALGKSGFEVETLTGINPFWDKSSQRDKVYMLATKLLALITLGHTADLAFLQFAFRAKIKQ